MTPTFRKGNKQLIITPKRMIRIYHTPQEKIDEALKVVHLALDRKLPFAYKTVKPMYYLEYQGMQTDKYGENRRYWYKQCVSFDTVTRNQFMNNYYKLKRALRLLHDEGYVKTYWVRNDRRKFRCIWYVDNPDKPLNVTEIHYGAFPPDYQSDPHIPRYKYRKKAERKERYAGGMLNAMRSAFPITGIQQGRVQPYHEPKDPNGGDWDSYDMVMREEANRIQQGNTVNVYQQGKELRGFIIAVFAYYCKPDVLGKVVDAYA